MSDADTPRLPDSLAELLDQQDPERLAAIRARCESLLAEYDLADEIEDQTYS
jgi:hypothetical protein